MFGGHVATPLPRQYKGFGEGELRLADAPADAGFVPPPMPRAKPRRRTLLVVLAIIAVLLLAAGAVAWAVLSRNKTGHAVGTSPQTAPAATTSSPAADRAVLDEFDEQRRLATTRGGPGPSSTPTTIPATPATLPDGRARRRGRRSATPGGQA